MSRALRQCGKEKSKRQDPYFMTFSAKAGKEAASQKRNSPFETRSGSSLAKTLEEKNSLDKETSY
jgi:hypothetical protein